ncbi:MAG: hypothetical protein LUE14_12365 [Clostridiales bacterium]|nr:hypothetical protein [Clostridiales bacterium]
MWIAYKAFNPDLSCGHGSGRFRYLPQQWNEEPEANCVRNGFHSAEDPVDCLSYYPLWDNAVYWAVLLDGEMNEDGTDTKIASTRLKPLRQLTLEEFVFCACKYRADHPYLSQEDVEKSLGNGASIRIVRGKDPSAEGNKGDVIGLLKEAADSPRITDISVFTIDGRNFLPGVVYGLDCQVGKVNG